MICELGAAYHSEDEKGFRRMYCTAILVSLGVGVVLLATMGTVALFLPQLFDIPDTLAQASQWFVIIYSLRVFIYIILAPTFNMYLVAERMSAFNFWMTLNPLAGFRYGRVKV